MNTVISPRSGDSRDIIRVSPNAIAKTRNVLVELVRFLNKVIFLASLLWPRRGLPLRFARAQLLPGAPGAAAKVRPRRQHGDQRRRHEHAAHEPELLFHGDALVDNHKELLRGM